jgi:D-alanyl-D-alanine carboxypeptidase/D-alanyl-D-alanine-endopeptidase (penicillin-binding protein 4)
MIDDIGTYYATPVSAINIDKNLISLKVSPTSIGKLAEIQVDTRYIVNSQIITNEEKSFVKLTWSEGIINATGSINSKDSPLEFKISPRNHDEYVLHKINNILASLKIRSKVKIIKDKNFSKLNFQPLNFIESPSLAEIIKPAMKISDNLVFDSIYLSIINSYNKEDIEDWEQGHAIIKKLVNIYFGIDTGNALFVDGSGLSRYNRIQPSTLLSLLKKGFEIHEFVDSLPFPGEENSTLKDRLQLPNNIIAKTGNMSGISCLCGYDLRGRHPKAFVLMSNSFAPPSKELFGVIDNFMKTKVDGR